MSRKYTQAEFQAILAKAVAERDAGTPERSDGMSLTEIKQIGEEVGIDPEALERAARTLHPVGSGTGAVLLGGPTNVSIERRTDGELAPDATGEILSAIRRGMGTAGQITDVQGLVEWRTSGELGTRTITISSSGGVTTVSGMADFAQAAAITHLPASLLGFTGSAMGFLVSANAGNELAMIFFAALLPVVLLATRRIYAHIARSEAGKLERVVDELARLVEGAATPASESTDATPDAAGPGGE